MHGKSKCPCETGDEGGDHYWLFCEALDEKSGWNRHHAVGDEERKRQDCRGREADVKAFDDVRHDGSEDVRQERHDEEDQEDQPNDVVASAQRDLA